MLLGNLYLYTKRPTAYVVAAIFGTKDQFVVGHLRSQMRFSYCELFSQSHPARGLPASS